jgi:anti-sigma regulatory factor (Ser/Thr protein kinase)
MMSNSHTITFGPWIFLARRDSLVPISNFVMRAAETAGLDARAIYQVQMGVEEACDNIIEHAYAGKSKGDIECTCIVDHKGLTVILRDHGRAFNPKKIPEPDRKASLEERKTGGLGLYFINQLMDEVHFSFSPDKGNVLTMVKRRASSS